MHDDVNIGLERLVTDASSGKSALERQLGLATEETLGM